MCPVNRNSIDYLLSSNGTGNAVVIVIGGAAESLNCTPGMNSVTLKNRKGFVKLALNQGWEPQIISLSTFPALFTSATLVYSTKQVNKVNCAV